MKTLLTVGLGIVLLFMESVSAAAGVPGDQVRQTTDKLLAILEYHGLLGEDGLLHAGVELVSIGDHFDYGSAEQAEEVLKGDELLDALYYQIVNELLGFMMEDTKNIRRLDGAVVILLESLLQHLFE